MITPLSLDDPLETARYWGSTLLDAGAQTVINIIAVRRNIEVFFEDIKDLSGADHYHRPQATYRHDASRRHRALYGAKSSSAQALPSNNSTSAYPLGAEKCKGSTLGYYSITLSKIKACRLYVFPFRHRKACQINPASRRQRSAVSCNPGSEG